MASVAGPVTISRTATVNYFKAGSDARLNSGSPGYLINSALKTGQASSVPLNPAVPKQAAYVNEFKHGFRLRGADNSGQCYKIKKDL